VRCVGKGIHTGILLALTFELWLPRLTFPPVGAVGGIGKSEPDVLLKIKEKAHRCAFSQSEQEIQATALLAQCKAGRLVLAEQGERQAQKSSAKKQQG
jgi:hypothetical protein